jgi:aryl-alcohol dehydrogenase-like predicted oxidoreductase
MKRISRRTFVGTTATAAGASLVTPLADRLTGSLEAAPALPRRPFGSTGTDVTMIGLGGGSRFYLPVPDDEVGAEMVRQSIERGIQFIETSANYGPSGESERRIGMAMRTHRSRVFLETKIDARDYDGAMRELDRSLERLQTDKIDLVLHHFFTDLDQIKQAQSNAGAEKALRKMIDQGVVRYRGFSCHSPELTLEGIDRLQPQALQLIMNATRVPDMESEVLPKATALGIAVIVMKSCGKGYFLRHNFTTPDRIDRYGPPKGVFDRKDLPTAREYLAYALSLPVATVVVGIDSIDTLNAVLRDVSGFKPLTAVAMESIADRAQVFRTTGFWV